MPRRVVFFYPGRTFPAVSITGSDCGLRCDHCQGRYLSGMHHVRSPRELIRLAIDLEAQGSKGLLVSGGCLPDGFVPLVPFIDAIAEIKALTDLELNIHTGLLDRTTAQRLAGTGADRFSLDIVQDRRVIGELLHLDRGPEAYAQSLEHLSSSEARAVPHICIDLPLSSTRGERDALELVARNRISALVVLGFVPTRGTPTENYPSASSTRILDFIRDARDVLTSPILLGCMRPRGDRMLERRALEMGIDGIATPSKITLEWARNAGYQVSVEERCCALYL